MSRRFDQLTARHRSLLARCELQRGDLAHSAYEIESQLSRIDRGVAMVRNIVHSPALIAGGIALVAFLGPRRILRWAGRGVFWLATARRVMRVIEEKRIADGG